MVVQLGLVPRKTVIAIFWLKMSKFKLIWSSQRSAKFFNFLTPKLAMSIHGRNLRMGYGPS